MQRRWKYNYRTGAARGVFYVDVSAPSNVALSPVKEPTVPTGQETWGWSWSGRRGEERNYFHHRDSSPSLSVIQSLYQPTYPDRAVINLRSLCFTGIKPFKMSTGNYCSITARYKIYWENNVGTFVTFFLLIKLTSLKSTQTQQL
jgi:hypothetical protein